MNKMQLFLLSLMLPIFMGYASGCKPVVGCKPLCKNKDGSLDITFGDHGTVITDIGANDSAQGVVVLPCGRIVAAGFSNSSGSNDFALAGYTSYGVLDTKFGPNGTGIVLTDFATVLNSEGGSFAVPSEDFANAIALQTNCDGCDYVCGDRCKLDCNRNCKLVVVGSTTVLLNGPSQFGIARYNCDGSLDITFGLANTGVQVVSIGVVSIAQAVAIQEDNKIVVAGFTTNDVGRSDFALVRLNCDGTLDTTFGCDGSGIVTTDFDDSDDFAYAIKIQKNGKIVVAGSTSDGSNASFALARYNSDGRLDRSFGPDHNGKVVTAFSEDSSSIARALVLLEDCDLACGCDDSFRIVAIGSTTANTGDDAGISKIALAGYTAFGSLDKNFGSSGTGLVTTTFIDSSDVFANAAVVQRDCSEACKIVVAGGQHSLSSSPFTIMAQFFTFMLARYDANGILDKEFGKVTTAIQTDSQVFAVALQGNGDIIAAGQSSPSNSNFALARYNICESCDCSCVKSDCAAC